MPKRVEAPTNPHECRARLSLRLLRSLIGDRRAARGFEVAVAAEATAAIGLDDSKRGITRGLRQAGIKVDVTA